MNHNFKVGDKVWLVASQRWSTIIDFPIAKNGKGYIQGRNFLIAQEDISTRILSTTEYLAKEKEQIDRKMREEGERFLANLEDPPVEFQVLCTKCQTPAKLYQDNESYGNECVVHAYCPSCKLDRIMFSA